VPLTQLKPALESSKGRVGPWGGARVLNAFAEQSDGDKAEMYAVQGISGLATWANLGSAPTRGAHWMAGVMYAVVGTVFCSIASNGTPTTLGTIPGTNPVRIEDNGTQIAIHDGNHTGYVWNGTTLATPLNLPSVSDVAFIDGYFVWSVYGGDQFVISAIGDGTSYDPLDIATVEGSPDALVGVVNSHRALLFFGTDTTEIWYDSGDPLFPFARDGNAFVERGCSDRDSTVKLDNTTFWVGNDRVVYRLNGYTPVRVSSYAVERTLDDAKWFRGFTYSEEGHKFYVLNTDLGCWAYDISGIWHERQSFGLNYYRVGCSVEAYGTTYLGSNQTGKFYTYDLDYNDEDGNPIPVTIQLPPVGDGVTRQNFYSLEIFMQTGVGDLVTTNPQAILTYSKDGGQNWSNEMWRTLGAQGQTKTRAIWRNLGEFRQIQLKLMFPDKVKRLVLSYNADIR
jgi:hypothetical protein